MTHIEARIAICLSLATIARAVMVGSPIDSISAPLLRMYVL